MIIQTNLILNIMLKINEKRSQTYCLKNVVTFHYLCVDSPVFLAIQLKNKCLNMWCKTSTVGWCKIPGNKHGGI